jgi:UDP-2,3-diacylglucosamine pyrophosphatase LpxH
LRKRKLDICVISDAHLGTYGCYADELLAYLSSIEPSILILNGDMIDVWNFQTPYFPSSHLNVVEKILSMASNGTKVYYIKGNHDYMTLGTTVKNLGAITFCKKLVLNLNGKKTWFFHGDVFDVPLLSVKWFSKLGDIGFDILLGVNTTVNSYLQWRKKEKFSFSKKIKESGPNSEEYISEFENKVVDLARDNNFDCVVCGHVHHPKKQLMEGAKGNVLYLNSGDWVTHMTALEYAFKRWKLYSYENDKLSPFFEDAVLKATGVNELMTSIAVKKTEL